MGILAIVVIFIVLILLVRDIFLHRQLKKISVQLKRRLHENMISPISLELANSDLNSLVANLNDCFTMEEGVRLHTIRREKQFKELIANISHDLRTPLTVSKSFLQLLERSDLNAEQIENLHIALRHTVALEKLIEQFFEFSYLSDSELAPCYEKLNLTNITTECIADTILLIEEKGLSLNLIGEKTAFISADKDMTIRIIQNLLKNCINHSIGTITVNIRTGTHTKLIVTNPVQNADKIDVNCLFDRFYKVETANSSTGLGLSIVKLLVEQMGGKTYAELRNSKLSVIVSFPLGSSGVL